MCLIFLFCVILKISDNSVIKRFYAVIVYLLILIIVIKLLLATISNYLLQNARISEKAYIKAILSQLK